LVLQLHTHHEPDERIGWHVHSSAYAAVVLEGGYHEAGDCGRFDVRPGYALFHSAFRGHWDRFGPGHSTILNIPVGCIADRGLFNVDDPDSLARLAERDVVAATELLMETSTPVALEAGDWPDLLAHALRSNPNLEIGLWAADQQLAPATVSRGFRRAFGVSPAHYRRRHRSLRALKKLADVSTPLAETAALLGFTDQSHMTNELRWLTGVTPALWRKRMVKPLQDH
jgi:AraC-like DNA-binding protein